MANIRNLCFSVGINERLLLWQDRFFQHSPQLMRMSATRILPSGDSPDRRSLIRIPSRTLSVKSMNAFFGRLGRLGSQPLLGALLLDCSSRFLSSSCSSSTLRNCFASSGKRSWDLCEWAANPGLVAKVAVLAAHCFECCVVLVRLLSDCANLPGVF